MSKNNFFYNFSREIVVNEAKISVKKLNIFRGIFIIKNYYGHVWCYVLEIFLSQVLPFLDKPSRRDERKTKIMLNLAKIIANFTRILTVSNIFIIFCFFNKTKKILVNHKSSWFMKMFQNIFLKDEVGFSWNLVKMSWDGHSVFLLYSVLLVV